MFNESLSHDRLYWLNCRGRLIIGMGLAVLFKLRKNHDMLTFDMVYGMKDSQGIEEMNIGSEALIEFCPACGE